ncbi:dual specificity protein phosphatase 7-like [Argiope bruennichi]|uniref:Dual specificity protein phosphatase n=1 Tax=Argiope bruennichi TaxID=94029 RepID=A0A8T0FGX0_ARGBR|nr:dual specificity protein phosphatase 7-like [Argiope bruennichi]KAF8790537.1 Dual specificity protein phosphatase 7 like protein [Argiope bruennichi]
MPSRDFIEDQDSAVQYLSAEDLLKRVRDPSSPLLLLDCRCSSDFAAGHIRGAINLTLPASSLMLRRLANGKLSVASLIQNSDCKDQFLKLWKEATLVLYDSDSETEYGGNSNTRVFATLLQRLRLEGCNVVCLQGGFENFKSLYPEWCESESSEASLLGLMALRISSVNPETRQLDSGLGDCSVGTPPFPVEILPHLYLGNASDSCDWNSLEKYGIHYVLNVTPNLPNTFEKTGMGMKYMQIPIQDHWSQNLSSFFPQAIKFIDEARKSKLGVLVHCLAGISRSVTITLAYLMHELNISLNEAYDFVQRRKANISPNLNFLGQLKDFERQLNLNNCHCSNNPNPCEHTNSSEGSTPDSAVQTDMWT